jgi:hypothetical protein
VSEILPRSENFLAVNNNNINNRINNNFSWFQMGLAVDRISVRAVSWVQPRRPRNRSLIPVTATDILLSAATKSAVGPNETLMRQEAALSHL